MQNPISLNPTIVGLSQAASLEQICEIALTTARTFAGADGATLVLREGQSCHYVDERAISPLWKGLKFPMEICISGWVMIHKEAVCIRDISKDARIPQDAYRPTFVKSLCMVPVGRGAPVAAIGSYWQYIHTPTSEQLFLLSALADAVAPRSFASKR